MRRTTSIIATVALASILSTCGGTEDHVAIEGAWVGKVAYDASESCGPGEPIPQDISGKEITLRVSRSANQNTDVLVTDQNGREYVGTDVPPSPPEFSVFSQDALVPATLTFSIVADDEATVRFSFFVNRFCDQVFEGRFTKVNL